MPPRWVRRRVLSTPVHARADGLAAQRRPGEGRRRGTPHGPGTRIPRCRNPHARAVCARFALPQPAAAVPLNPRRVLIVVHQEHSTPGRVGEMLAARGYALDRRCPSLGDPLPADVSAYAACVVFGGPQSANDDHLPGIRAELDWLERRALPSATPLLGICLGAQQMARVLGARVFPDPGGQVEIGYKPVAPTAHGSAFLPQPATFYQWHSETFEIPHGAVHLAENDAFPGQAFCYGAHAWAIEFHPEMTLAMINRWCTSERGSRKLALPGAQPHGEQLDDFRRHAAASDAWLARFLDRCLLGADNTDAESGPDAAADQRIRRST